MLAKLSDLKNKWSKHLPKVEFAINNSYCRSIGNTQCMILFGINQRDKCDGLRNHLDFENYCENRELEDLRNKAVKQHEKVQNCNKNYFNKRHKPP